MEHKARKRFGQNFLHDRHVIDRIVRAIHPKAGERLVEIGPGLGALTLPLLQAAGRLEVVELDRDLIPKLAEQCAGKGELLIHSADALKFDFCSLATDGKLRLAGNLPYNISTPLIFHLLDQARCIDDMHFMLQKEVVERLAAKPDTSDYGRLSVMVQFRCKVEQLFIVPPGAFTPAPKVESAIVRLEPYAEPPVNVDASVLEKLVAQAFGQRRKTLRNTLKGLLDAEAIEAAGIDPQRRAETLSLQEFAALANRVTG
ncbi:MAG: 16S rRNA (adenine(1518)-N(6)/adenine(1519)-N(6))-dimethyltransferase [Gammaproteobacteria bacterium HGW-Gammaproteobacteria-1]|jgi:16S rRNA (adenine1518-N6/adenine1519-N6)-dimethyltransferase|nr:MAG: 16S rRNA (adenine(1518)-N(6)/adenine(1519)-N(6))-dimethyltransferase [Gammaproteobacteria bacterium HGW-Gammaproteobacteria-1]